MKVEIVGGVGDGTKVEYKGEPDRHILAGFRPKSHRISVCEYFEPYPAGYESYTLIRDWPSLKWLFVLDVLLESVLYEEREP